MKRSVMVTGAAMVGVAWLVSYKVTPHTAGLASALPAQSPSPNQPSPSPTDPGSPSSTPSAAPSPSPSPSPTGANGTFTGSDFPNRFGDVQVKVIISNGRITDVQPIQMPQDRAQSAYISQVAGPMLHDEVIQAQSAQIDIISGATYTSQSYAQSVESALQQAHRG
ncbi:MAG TPA: FMN-binding protein [Candidatus Dormibacteraeota bacterium]|nr:FMN-binding protein [Candidatus Dormibacteraeota bacterium]